MRMAKRRITRRVGFEKCLIPWKELKLYHLRDFSYIFRFFDQLEPNKFCVFIAMLLINPYISSNLVITQFCKAYIQREKDMSVLCNKIPEFRDDFRALT